MSLTSYRAAPPRVPKGRPTCHLIANCSSSFRKHLKLCQAKRVLFAPPECTWEIVKGELANVGEEGNRLHDARRRASSGNTCNGVCQQSYAEQHTYNQLQITKIIIRGMGQVASNKNDTQSGNQVVLFLVRSLESAMPVLSINCDRFSSVFVRKTRQAHCYAQKN